MVLWFSFSPPFVQVATILAWEAFQAGFRNLTLNANVNLHAPDEDDDNNKKPKRREMEHSWNKTYIDVYTPRPSFTL